jgi:hypothetical protein
MFIANCNRRKEIKMKNKLFDDYVRKQFDGYKPEVGAHIWENIIRQKEKNRPVGFWYSTIGKVAATLLVLLTCTGVAYYLMHNKNTASKDVSINEQKNNLPTINVPQENNKINSNQAKEILSTNQEVQLLEKVLTNSNNTIHNSNVILNNTKQTTPTKLNPEDDNNLNNNTKKYKNVVENTAVNGFKSTAEKNTNNGLVANIVNENIVDHNRLFVPALSIKKLPNIAFIPCPEAEENTAGNKRYIEIYGGPDYIFKTYTDTGDAYIARRKASTGIHYAFSAGARYTKVFGSGISFRTGLNYSQINERFIAFNGFVLERFVQVNGVGDTIANYTTATVQYKRSTNIYRSIDIPLQAGFELGNGKFHTNLSAGAFINIISKQTGNIVEPNGNVIDLSSNKPNSKYQYRSNVGVSFLGTASVYYKLNKNLHLMAEPYIRYSLSPLTKPDITFKQKFHTAGLRMGVRMDL